MRKVIFAINMSADGYCSHTDMVAADDELHKYFADLLRNGDVLLYGRVTYELMVPFWPDVARDQSESEITNEFALVFDSMEKILFSKTWKKVEDPHTRLAKESLADEVISLKKKPGKDILVGSLSLASQLSELHLIDEYRFVIHPVISGNGPKLFDAVKLNERLRLDLLGSETFESGAVALRYRKSV
ncbi:dihydrofolate reductase [Leptospira langatensis]|uniref:Dihydrofolate reductase n=1 Tax=Leptospira langatensis TaxID=2484983 RepID=A0A5F1ZX65_9LEPT|nr:dihydrofolate reductase family protein [Leptospira langatensis]TGJ98364.1 dihydrofolate reductase [Leptospira langatensis]TGL43278.1 dihydrofolate reductase [Leptospira langatensis]